MIVVALGILLDVTAHFGLIFLNMFDVSDFNSEQLEKFNGDSVGGIIISMYLLVARLATNVVQNSTVAELVALRNGLGWMSY